MFTCWVLAHVCGILGQVWYLIVLIPDRCILSYFNLDLWVKVSKGAKIWNRYNQVPHLTQDINGKVTNTQLDSTNESPEVSPFPAGDHKAQINRRAYEGITKTRLKKKTVKDPQKK